MRVMSGTTQPTAPVGYLCSRSHQAESKFQGLPTIAPTFFPLFGLLIFVGCGERVGVVVVVPWLLVIVVPRLLVTVVTLGSLAVDPSGLLAGVDPAGLFRGVVSTGISEVVDTTGLFTGVDLAGPSTEVDTVGLSMEVDTVGLSTEAGTIELSVWMGTIGPLALGFPKFLMVVDFPSTWGNLGMILLGDDIVVGSSEELTWRPSNTRGSPDRNSSKKRGRLVQA